MTAEEYFEDWIKVLDKKELSKIMRWLPKDGMCSTRKDVFKAFRILPYNECRQIWIGMDPYPQKGVATGLLFGNNSNTPEDLISPSLRIVRDAMIDYTIPRDSVYFDITMESIAKQGVLLLNSALTCAIGDVGSHTSIWSPFMSKFIQNMTSVNSGLVFILFGNQAKSFIPDIKGFQHVLTERHPAFYARRGIDMSPQIFIEANRLSKELNNIELKYYGV